MDIRNAVQLLPIEDVDDYVVNTKFDFAKFRVGAVDFSALSKADRNEYVTHLVRSVLGDAGLAVLHGDAPQTTEKREEFFRKLNTVIAKQNNVSTTTELPAEQNTISLQKLLNDDPQFLELYKEALREEKNSTAYRNAVFVKALTMIEGPQLLQAAYIFVGGPSAAGKSYYAPSLLKEIFTSAMPQDNYKPDAANYVVAIDGGIDRELSQVRSLVLQVALNKGYAGIHDLQEMSEASKLGKLLPGAEKSIKQIVKKAVLTNPALSLIVPTTFTQMRATNVISKLHDNPGAISDRQVVYAEVKAKEDQPKSTVNAENFRSTVFLNGIDRAYVSKCKVNANATYVMNSKAPCESKEYKPKNFVRGRDNSNEAGEMYRKLFQDSIYIPIVSETYFRYKNDKNDWVVAPADYKGEVTRVNQADFERWEKIKVPDLKEWLKENEKSLAKVKITPEIRGQKLLQGQLYELKQEYLKLSDEPSLTQSGSRNSINMRSSGGRGSRSGSLTEFIRRGSSAGRSSPVEVATSTNDNLMMLISKCSKFVDRMDESPQSFKVKLEMLAEVDQLALQVNSLAKSRGQSVEIRGLRDNIGRHKDDIVNNILGQWTDKISELVEVTRGDKAVLIAELNKIVNVLQQYLPYVQDNDNFLAVYQRLLERIDSPDPAISPRAYTPKTQDEDSSESAFVIPGKDESSAADDDLSSASDGDIIITPKEWSLDLIISNLREAKEFDLGLVKHCLECFKGAEGGSKEKMIALNEIRDHLMLAPNQQAIEISTLRSDVQSELNKTIPAKEKSSTAQLMTKLPVLSRKPLPPIPVQSVQQPPQPPPVVERAEEAAVTKPKPLPAPGRRRE